MTIYYVDPLGTDDAGHGTGTGTSAWKTMEYALESGGLTQDDELVVGAGVYVENTIDPASIGAGSGTLLVRANGEVRVRPNAGVANIFKARADIVYRGFVFEDPGEVGAELIRFVPTQSNGATFEDCEIEMNPLSGIVNFNGITTACSVRLKRCRTRTQTNHLKVLLGAGGSCSIRMEACLCVGGLMFLNAPSGGSAALTLRNCTLVGQTADCIHLEAAGNVLDVRNCIIEGPPADTGGAVKIAQNAIADSRAHPENYVFEDNVIWREDAMELGRLRTIVYADGYTLDHFSLSNRFISPDYVDRTGGDYALAGTGFVHGWGDDDYLPTGGDINGDAFHGGEIGCHAVAAPKRTPPLGDKHAFIGDSVMQGWWPNVVEEQRCDSVLRAMGLDVVDNSPGPSTALGGTDTRALPWLANNAIFAQGVRYGYFADGLNHTSGGALVPSGVTKQAIATVIVNAMQAFEGFGGVPMWLGCLPDPGDNLDTLAYDLNALVENECRLRGWVYTNIYERMRMERPDDFLAYYWDSQSTDIHPNARGQAFIAQLAYELWLLAREEAAVEIGAATPGTRIRIALSWDGDAVLAALNGGECVEAGFVIPALAALVLGGRAADAPSTVRISRAALLGQALDSAQLRRVTA
jgi:hypothetical protein